MDLTGWDAERDAEIGVGDEVPEKPWIACNLTFLSSPGRGRETLECKSGPALLFVNILNTIPGNPITGDARSDARQFIFEMIMTNEPYANGNMAALTASAIVWLARSSSVGPAVGDIHKHIHYEITDMGTAPDGRKMQNYRLILTHDPHSARCAAIGKLLAGA
jgi:hypothetical protein